MICDMCMPFQLRNEFGDVSTLNTAEKLRMLISDMLLEFKGMIECIRAQQVGAAQRCPLIAKPRSRWTEYVSIDDALDKVILFSLP